MLSESGIDRYHFRMTDNHDGGTFDCDVDFESDLLIIVSDSDERARVSNIMGKAQRDDFMNIMERFGIMDLKTAKCTDGRLVVRSEGSVGGRNFKAVLPAGENSTVKEFAMHLLSISQYIGLKDCIVDRWRSTIAA